MTLRELIKDPSILDRLQSDKKAKQKKREQKENEYYEALGELIEQHPIVSPRRIRG